MNLRRQAIKSVGWLAATRLWSQAVSWLVTIVLARFLLPAEYGLFAMALAVIHLLEPFQDLGLGAGLVQRRELADDEVNAVFWFSVAASVVLAAGVFLTAGLAARYYGEPALVPMIRVLAVTFLLSSVAMVPYSLLTKAIDFRHRSLADGCGILASGAISVPAVYLGYGVWALVAGHVGRAVVRTAMLVAAAGWRPGLRLSFRGLAGVLRFGVYLTLTDLVGYLSGFFTTAIVGRALGSSALGLLSMADSIGRQAMNKISVSVINQMSLPVFSKLQDDLAALRRYFLKITKYVALVSCPLQVGMILVGHDLIVIVLSPPWLPMLEVFRIFAAGGVIYILSLSASPVLFARGRPGVPFRVVTAISVSGVLALLIGVRFGLVGVALAWLFTSCPLRLLMIWLALREMGLGVTGYARTVAAPLAASGAMAAVVLAFQIGVGASWGPLPRLAGSVALGAAAYAAGMAILDRSVGSELRGIMREMFALGPGVSRPVLVVEAQALGTIGVIRSLGRAGYAVHAASDEPAALGLRSRFASAVALHPPYGAPEFLPWLERYLAAHRIQAIVPSEGFLHAVGAAFDRIRAYLPDANDPAVWQRCLSKVATQERLAAQADTATHLPRGGVITDAASIPAAAALRAAAGPYYLKADAGRAKAGRAARVRRCESAEELRDLARAWLADYHALLWQAHAPGQKVGVSLWSHGGQIRAENMVLSIHQRPHTGGMMSLRRTWWHEGLLADARRKLEALGWQGVAMMEYKWDPVTDDFWLIEVNSRYWGYLHLDLFADKDFPRLQMDAFFGAVRTDLGPARVSRVCRHTIPGEWSYLSSRLRDPHVPKGRKLASTLGFLGRFLHPTMRSDLLFPGDRALYWRELGRAIRSAGGHAAAAVTRRPDR